MKTVNPGRLLAAILLVLGSWLHAAADEGASYRLLASIHQFETQIDARIGVHIREADDGWSWGYRENERFLMTSTFKPFVCAAILDRVERGKLSLNEQIVVRRDAMLDYAPVTRRHVGAGLTIGQLCFAALDKSDNPATNLLLERLGGPSVMTAFLRGMGDKVTRLDRVEPFVNEFRPGDPRDTSAPSAMTQSWLVMLTGSALDKASRKHLMDWMKHGGVTAALLRPHVPVDWLVADKSGGGRTHTRGIVAMLKPPRSKPFFVAIFVSDTPAGWSARNAVIGTISARVIDLIRARLKN